MAAGTHKRNVKAMMASPRCGAKTRSGSTCRSPAMHGKKRCRMHGGTKGSGAPKGNQNALKHGYYSKHAIEERCAIRDLIKGATDFLDELD